MQTWSHCSFLLTLTMTLFIFKYLLPSLLGYTLFVGIAVKFNPFHKPEDARERPSWALGLWTGLSISIVLAVSLNMAYGLPVETTKSLAIATGVSLLVLIGLGFVGYFVYRRKIMAKMRALNPHTNADAFDTDAVANAVADAVAIPNTTSNADLDAIPNVAANTARAESEVATQEIAVSSDDGKASFGSEIEISAPTMKVFPEPEEEEEEEESFQFEIDDEETPSVSVPVLQDSFGELDHDLSIDTFDQTGLKQLEELEASVANLKRELVKAKHETRLHIAARAKALSTANKSVAFARQSVELRGRLEAELDTAHIALANRQSTITSLIGKLERERRLTAEELQELAPLLAVNDPTKFESLNATSSEKTQNDARARFTSGGNT